MDDSNSLRFFRITVLGSTACGKSSLVNSYVNRNCPARYTTTEKAVAYLKKLDLVDETEYNDVRRPVLLEIEDTPGSDRGNDEDSQGGGGGAGASPAKDGPPKVAKGSKVMVLKDKQELRDAFAKFKQLKAGKQTQVAYKQDMERMCGREFKVISMGKDGSINLPAPEGTEGGTWAFPSGAVKMSNSMKLPIDDFLTMGEKEKEKVENISLKEKKKYALAMQRPLSAYKRPIGTPEVDKTLTRNRMGFLICFDVSEEEGGSLKEAMAVHKMLLKSLEMKVSVLSPIVWLVACKCDKTGSEKVVRQNLMSAELFCEQQELIMYKTSAKCHQGVHDVFSEMVQAISARANLWILHDDVEDGEDEEDKSACFSQ